MNRNKYYTYDFKLKVVKEVLAGNISKEACRLKYGIKGHSTILKWIRNFQSMKEELLFNDRSDGPEIERLKAQMDRLKKELEYERLRVKVYGEVIKMAEEELNISIIKKSGAKQ